MSNRLTATCLAVILLVGCASSSDRKSSGGTGSREEVTSRNSPKYPRDKVVLQVAHGGGFRMPDRVSNEIPDVTLWGDGRVVFAATDGTVREGRLERAVVDQLVGRAIFLYGLIDDYAAVTHTDAPMATFTVFTVQGRKTVSVYGLDPKQPNDGESHPEIFTRLRELWADVYAALPQDAPMMVPTVVQVLTFYSDAEATVDWPSALQRRLTGDLARRAVELAGQGEARNFRVDGKAQQVLVVPVLPRPWAWEDDPIGLPEQLTGHNDEENLSLEAKAERQPDDSYTVSVTIKSKAPRGIDLLFNCGSLLWWQGLRPAKANGNEVACPGVYSQLLEAGQMSQLKVALAPGNVVDWKALSVSLRYEVHQDGGSSGPKDLTANLRPAAQ